MITEEKNIMLQAKNLSIGYVSKKETNTISEGINFSINTGELVGLVGTNGVGKSTLLRTLAGMQEAVSGEIILNNKSISNYIPQELARYLSIVLTETPASKNLTVLELVSLGRQPYTNWMGKLTNNDKKIISEALTATETITLSHRKTFELSDGQLQRVAIARALAQDTPVIILDEPTTHLDLYHRAYILKLLKQLATTASKTILFSTHEIDLAIQLADKMLVMTPKATYYNTPNKLIEAERFNSLFPEDTITFNKETRRFNVKK